MHSIHSLWKLSSLALLYWPSLVPATVTIYTTLPGATTTTTAITGNWTGVASQNPIQLTPPVPPTGQSPQVAVQLYDGGMSGLGIPVNGSFLGFSIELSVSTTLLGQNASNLHPTFLNYVAVLQSRGGGVTIRVGGNTQDLATLELNGTETGATIAKYQSPGSTPTSTPTVHFTNDLLKAMAQISTMLNVKWYFGIPFLNVNSDGNAAIVVQQTTEILGSNLLGFQMANEPDLYGPHGKKDASYSVANFFNDTSTMISTIPINQQIMIGPSVCCNWWIDDVLNAGYLDQFNSQLNAIDVMHYPNNNCAGDIVPQDVLPNYLTHQGVTNLTAGYFGAATRAHAAGKSFVMLETNTASCGGFLGVSDSFTAALWGVDYALQMAYGNFTAALWHFGGQNTYYNPFTPPPTNQTSFRKWTTGAIFYSNIVVAEALGKSGNARVLDLALDGGNPNRAGYAVYENGVASRVVLINYVSDSTGANDFIANVAIGGQQTGLPSLTPSTVQVKYLLAPSISEKYNITWANQTMGGQFQSDGRLYNDISVVTITCDTTNGICPVPVRAPSVALVFLTQQALTNSGGSGDQDTLTFATSTLTRQQVTIDYASVATSNGRSGQVPLGSTSEGNSEVADSGQALTAPMIGWSTLLVAMILYIA